MSYSLLYSLGGIGKISSGWTADHWKISLFNGSLLRNLLYSFLVSATSVLISTVVSLSLTFAFHQSRNSRTLLALLCIPLGTPAAVNALIVYQILNPGGFISRTTWHLGLTESPSNFPPSSMMTSQWES